MEEFDFDLNNDMGTSVSQLKLKANNEQNDNTHTEDFDYDKVMEHFNSEQNNSTFNYETSRDSIINTMGTTLSTDIQPTEMFTNTDTQQIRPQFVNENRPKKQQNMNKFVRDLENNLDNFGKVNLNEPLPVNFTKPMIPKQVPSFTKPKLIETMGNIKQEKLEKQEIKKDETILDSFKNFFKSIDFREIIICVLLFMVLNNKIVIELIYDKVPYIKTIDSPYPNLILRTLVFGIILIGIKKFNL